MSTKNDLLIEIGTEELPPKALKKLSDAFTSGIVAGLEKVELAFGEVKPYASPRRLAVLIHGLDTTRVPVGLLRLSRLELRGDQCRGGQEPLWSSPCAG